MCLGLFHAKIVSWAFAGVSENNLEQVTVYQIDAFFWLFNTPRFLFSLLFLIYALLEFRKGVIRKEE